MYKELNNSIKGYVPTSSDWDRIVDRFLSHNFIHRGDNLFGEMYEAWVYEYFKSWAYQNQDVSTYIIKDCSFKSSSGNGLNYDKNGQIIFLKDGKKLAEYDGLFIYRNRVVFIESSVSELRSYYRKIEDRLIIKRALLVDHFKTEEVYYLMVTRPKKRTLVYRSLPHLVLYKLKNPDFESLKISSRVSNLLSSKFKDLTSFSSSF